MPFNARPTIPRDFSVFGDWLSEVFRLWGQRWQVWVLQGVIFFCITFVPAIIFYIVGIVGVIAQSVRTQGDPDSAMLGVMAIMYGLLILGGFISLMLYPGMVNTALKQIRGQDIAVSDLFSGMRYFWGYFVASFYCGLGALACGVGMYAVYGLLFLALPLMIDREFSTMQAIGESWDTTKQNFWFYVLFAFVAVLLGTIGASACYIGMVVTIPFLALAQVVAYERTYHPRIPPAETEKPGEYLPPPPYSGM